MNAARWCWVALWIGGCFGAGGERAVGASQSSEPVWNALQLGERAEAAITPERPWIEYRIQPFGYVDVEVTVVALDGGDPAIAVHGPRSETGEWPLVIEQDAALGPLERVAPVMMGEGAYRVLVTAPESTRLETTVAREAYTARWWIQQTVLAEPAPSHDEGLARWTELCAATERQMRDELGHNRIEGFDCGDPVELAKGAGGNIVASVGAVQFVAGWPIRQENRYRALAGQASDDAVVALESWKRSCEEQQRLARQQHGSRLAVFSCGAVVDEPDPGGPTHQFRSDVDLFVFPTPERCP